ncbi:RAF-like serine/threonine-protein kinase 24 [Nicotiana tabacum]|uniref:RAF-like serine/threonine-protein kinase 24 n=2 Tax=Nicotiana tabacum TaxID=4097 RepID=A0AC58SZF5_TOBAC
MDRDFGKGMMGQQNNFEQARYSSIETRTEVIGSSNQRFFQDSCSSISADIRPPDFIVPVGARPVNYSFQTGEEFSLEFMRERVNPKQNLIPHGSGGTTGISHTGSESGSDISMIASVGKTRVQHHQRSSTSINEGISNHQAVQTGTRASSRNNNVHGIQSHMSSRSSTSTKLKFLCSFGGRIIPRPSDGKLRYVGGDTHLVRVSKDISWEELRQKMLTIFNNCHTVKYQLPGEDLDALVSVSCDEDLQNMIEECNVLEGDGSQKIRIFLFSNSDLEDSLVGLENIEGDSEMQYVIAVNGMDFGSRRNSVALASTSENNLDEFLSATIAGVNGQVARDLAEADTSDPVIGMPLTNQSAHVGVGVSISSHTFDSNQPGYLGQTVYHGGTEWQPLPSSIPVDSFRGVDGESLVLPSVQLRYNHGYHPPNMQVQYNHGYHPPNSSQVTDNFLVSSGHGYMNWKGDVALEQSYQSSHMNNYETPATVVNLKRDNSSRKLFERSKDHREKEVLEEGKIKIESSLQKINEPEKMCPLECERVVSSNPLDDSTSSHVPRVEVSTFTAVAVAANSVTQSKINDKIQEQVQSSASPEAVQEEKLDRFTEDGFSRSGRTSNAGYGDSETHPLDFSYEQSSIPSRPYRSEWIPREQPGLNRLSRSDDSSASQFIMTHAHSGGTQHIIESVDKLHDGNVAPQTEHVISSGRSLSANQRATAEKGVKFQESIELSVSATEIYTKGAGEVSEANLNKPELKAATYADKVKSGLGDHIITSSNVQAESASGQTELHWGDAAANRAEGNKAAEQIQPLAVKECQVGEAASTERPSVTVGTIEHGSILFDINDRFPRDFLADIFSKAKLMDASPVPVPLHTDGTDLSLNMENHEPKHWSFFQKIAQGDFGRRDVSLMDQDHLSMSSTCANVDDGVSMDSGYHPFQRDGAMIDHMDSQLNIEAEFQQPSPEIVGPDTMDLPSEYKPSQTTYVQSMLYDGELSSKIPESGYQDENQGAQNAGFPPTNLSLGDFDPSSLQIITNEDLEELKELGSGTFGTVYHGKWRGTDVAIKRIKKSCFTGRSSEQERLTVEFWREAEILSKLHHPNVVAFYGVVQDGPGGTLATVAEFMVNGSLRHVLLCKDRHLDRRKRLIIAMDAAFGMEYLHSKNIVHFDLKCDNLLVNLKDPSRPICKVADFGLSKIKRNTLVTGGVRGTLPWMAPELLNGGSNKVSEKVDVFSFGIVLWEILTGEEPYANMHYGAIIGGIVSNTLRPPVPSFCDSEWRMLMEQCWAPDPAIRPSFSEIARRLRAMAAACPTRPQAHPTQNKQPK